AQHAGLRGLAARKTGRRSRQHHLLEQPLDAGSSPRPPAVHAPLKGAGRPQAARESVPRGAGRERRHQARGRVRRDPGWEGGGGAEGYHDGDRGSRERAGGLSQEIKLALLLLRLGISADLPAIADPCALAGVVAFMSARIKTSGILILSTAVA